MVYLIILLAIVATTYGFHVPGGHLWTRNNVARGCAAESTSDAEALSPPNPSLLDIRVGEIKKCWNHPDSEKLLCEEIDCGEESGPRSIASGIAAFYKADEFVGKKVLVLANLKDRKLAGFLSQGMVLCASTEDGSDVKILEPPAGAANGDRVVFSGVENGEPASSSQMKKKKILEKLAPMMKTDESGAAFCGESGMTVSTGEDGELRPVTSQLKSAAIS